MTLLSWHVYGSLGCVCDLLTAHRGSHRFRCPSRNRGLRFWCYTSSKRRPQPASNSDNGPRGTDADEPCKFRFRDAPGSSPPPAPRWDQHELDRQISDLGTILATQVVEFDTARDLPWINITGVTQRGRFRLPDAGPRLIADRIAAVR